MYLFKMVVNWQIKVKIQHIAIIYEQNTDNKVMAIDRNWTAQSFGFSGRVLSEKLMSDVQQGHAITRKQRCDFPPQWGTLSVYLKYAL